MKRTKNRPPCHCRFILFPPDTLHFYLCYLVVDINTTPRYPIPLLTSPLPPARKGFWPGGKGEEYSDFPPLQGEGQGAAVQSRHNDAKVSTGTMAPDGGGGVRWPMCLSSINKRIKSHYAQRNRSSPQPFPARGGGGFRMKTNVLRDVTFVLSLDPQKESRFF